LDATQILTFFDHFKAKHERTCRAERLDVDMERGGPATRIVLKCPVCQNTIAGIIEDHDMPAVRRLLDPSQAN
jgi:hypothetical protein